MLLCPKGHYWTRDCNIVAAIIEKNNCPICKEKAIWENMVDVTNGSFDSETGERIDGYIELKVKKKTSGKCSKCGGEHVCEVTYKIPEEKK